ncbi:MAG: hypothetical protein AAF318_17830 [Pseudomonadota bacterium]
MAVEDVAEDDLHPQLETIGLEGRGPQSILATRLFRPGTAPDQHEPVHRIVAEHGAARALVARTESPDYQLSVRQCLALVAPNGVVRDDLRGLLGWMAALGSQAVQDAAIALDPYAVLSNGDPSRLTVLSRTRLLDALQELNADDPFFRRSDKWRFFAVSGFFTPDVVEAVRPILARPDDGHLRGLLLELLIDTPGVADLRSELEAIALDRESDHGSRSPALSCLLNDEAYDLTPIVERLIDLGDVTSLRLATESLTHLGKDAPYGTLRALLGAAANLNPSGRHNRSQVIDARFFLWRLIETLETDATASLLTDLTENLCCTCHNERHACRCRDAISKIVGLLFDTYFARTSGPYDPDQVWAWIKNLQFHRHADADRSCAVKVLQDDSTLRRALQKRAFEGLENRDDLVEVLVNTIQHFGHSGIRIAMGDARHLIDWAYQTDNAVLWSIITPAHNFYDTSRERGPNELRRHCREQARSKQSFMREWARLNGSRRALWQHGRPMRLRSEARRRRRERRVTAANTEFFYANRAAVENGESVRWTHNVAQQYLTQPGDLDRVTHGLFDPEVMLRRSLASLRSRCPSMEEVGRGDATLWQQIFLAGALAQYRETKSLSEIAQSILRVILPAIAGYSAYKEGELETFREEVRRWILSTKEEQEAYARACIEPSLLALNEWSDIQILEREPALKHLRASLPLEWLERFRDLPEQALDELFNMAARHAPRASLVSVIRQKCGGFTGGPLEPKCESRRRFWFLRDFSFAQEVDEDVWAHLAQDPDVVLWLAERRDRGHMQDNAWPPLSAQKVERILMAYLPHWPAVPLPSSWGSDSPRGERAYRYLRDVVWQIGRDDPGVAVPVVNRLLTQETLTGFHDDLRSIRAVLHRKAALPSSWPSPSEIATALDAGPPASVEQLRALTLELLADLQREIFNGPTGMAGQFYRGETPLDEPGAMNRVHAWLAPHLRHFDIHDVAEHYLNERDRCDLTATRLVAGRAKTLVIEAKGQWHPKLFSAAKAQLADRYSMYLDADEQGIFLIFWYGASERVAGRKQHGCGSASDLKDAIMKELPHTLIGRIDVVVIDVSRGETDGSQTAQP